MIRFMEKLAIPSVHFDTFLSIMSSFYNRSELHIEPNITAWYKMEISTSAR